MTRIGQPEDIGEMALHLVSDKASPVTAATVIVEGGTND